MLKGVVVAFGIMLASLLIPLVHFVTVPLGPFVAGGDVFSLNRWLVVGVAAAIVPYTWFGVTLGALVSYLLRAREQKAAAGKS